MEFDTLPPFYHILLVIFNYFVALSDYKKFQQQIFLDLWHSDSSSVITTMSCIMKLYLDLVVSSRQLLKAQASLVLIALLLMLVAMYTQLPWDYVRHVIVFQIVTWVGYTYKVPLHNITP